MLLNFRKRYRICSRKLLLLFRLLLGELGCEASWGYFQGPRFIDGKWKLLAGCLRKNASEKDLYRLYDSLWFEDNKFLYTRKCHQLWERKAFINFSFNVENQLLKVSKKLKMFKVLQGKSFLTKPRQPNVKE